jgi:DNA-binding transcriptional LysR family regulator
VQLEIGTGRLVPVLVADMAPIRRQIVAARRKDAGNPSPAAAAFLAILEEMRPEPGERRSIIA